MIGGTNRDGVIILEMHREPANVLDTEFCDAIEGTLRSAIGDDDASAIVLTGVGSTFSAGVDLFRLLREGDDYLTAFLASLHRLLETASTSPKPLVAAVNGHAIAGGGILALACDFRVMAKGSGTIGLPELKVGVPFPTSALQIVRSAVPRRHRREVILLGRNFGVREALERGLVDQVVPADELLDAAEALARELGAIPTHAFALTKRLLSTPDPDEIAALDAEVHAVWATAETREHIRNYLEQTRGKRPT